MENNSFVIDSSVLVAFYDDGDVHHVDALIVMKEIQGRNVLVHSYVIQEVATILCYRFGSLLAKRFLEDVINSENVFLIVRAVNFSAQDVRASPKKLFELSEVHFS